MLPSSPVRRSRLCRRRFGLVQAGVVACGVVAGLMELWALQRWRLGGRRRAARAQH